MTYTEEQIKEKYNKLPKEVKEAITSVDTTNKIIKISDKYKISIDKAGELVDETGLVMLGLTKGKDFVNHIKNRLEIPEDFARVLLKEINDDVLFNIREFLKKIHEREIIEEREGLNNNKQEINNSLVEKNLTLKVEPEKKQEHKEVNQKKNEIIKSPEKNLSLYKENEIINVKEESKENKPKVEDKEKEFIDPYREPIE